MKLETNEKHDLTVADVENKLIQFSLRVEARRISDQIV